MPPKEITRTRLSSASVTITKPRANATTGKHVRASGTAVVLMKMTERIGGGAPRVTEFPVVTGAFRVTVDAEENNPSFEVPIVFTRGKMTWRIPPRGFRFSDGQRRITALLRGSVDEVDTTMDLATGKVTHHRSRPKAVTGSHVIKINVKITQ